MDRARSLVDHGNRAMDRGGADLVSAGGAVAKPGDPLAVAMLASLAATGPDLGVGDLAGDSEWVRRG
jgi:hypothetical protein